MRYSKNNTNRIPNLVIENVHVMPFSNFAGKEGKFNKAGVRSFQIELTDPETIDRLRDLGWNVRERVNRDDETYYTLDVKVAYNDKAPHPEAEIISNNKSTFIGEDEIGMLDYAEVDRTDVVIAPYHYTFNGQEGVSAYLRKIRVWLASDGLSPIDTEEEPMPFE